MAPQRFFFVHLRKTAGTSLYLRLVRRFGMDAVYPTQADREGNPDVSINVDLLQHTFAKRRDTLRVVAGHFPLCVSEMLGVPFETISVLRDPVERTLSFLRHSKRLPELSDQTLEEIYAEPRACTGFVHNHMVKMLSMTPEEMDAWFRNFR